MKYKDEDIKSIVHQYVDGTKTVEELAKEYNTSKQYLYRIFNTLRFYGVDIPRKYHGSLRNLALQIKDEMKRGTYR